MTAVDSVDRTDVALALRTLDRIAVALETIADGIENVAAAIADAGDIIASRTADDDLLADVVNHCRGCDGHDDQR